MTKSKKKKKTNGLTSILPMHIIQEFSNFTYEERKNIIKEASELIKQKNIFGY